LRNASAQKLALAFASKRALELHLARANRPVVLRGDNFAARETPERNAKKPCAKRLTCNKRAPFRSAAREGYPAKRDSKIFVSIITYPHSGMKRLENSPSRLPLEGFVNIFLQRFAVCDSAPRLRDFVR